MTDQFSIRGAARALGDSPESVEEFAFLGGALVFLLLCCCMLFCCFKKFCCCCCKNKEEDAPEESEVDGNTAVYGASPEVSQQANTLI